MENPLNERILTQIKLAIALALWDSDAVKISDSPEFTLASGKRSPIYVNCRRLISYPYIVDLFSAGARLAATRAGLVFDCLAGGESAGIPFAAFLSRVFGKPMVYVRKTQKGHGLGGRVEGALTPGSHVLLVEDLITDAASKLDFIDALESAGAKVTDVLVLFDRRQGGGDALAQRGYRLHALADMESVLSVAETHGLLAENTLASIRDYLRNPDEWLAKHVTAAPK